ncbi:MAG: hypothetical protein RI554_08010 [Trueperaceae bacterium]|nr:hypothetical protein [Trueperaceae bacterium]
MPTKKQEQDPVLSENFVITVAGTEYEMRRLGLRDVFRVARILGNGVAVLGDGTNQYTPGQVVQVLIASMTRNETEVLALLADLLDVKIDDLQDPNKFPMESIIDVFEGLSEHQDLKSFLARIAALTERLPEMQTASQEPSTS